MGNPSNLKQLKNGELINDHIDMEELNSILLMINDFNRTNMEINEEISKLKNEIHLYKQMYQTQVINCKETEEESLALIEELQSVYDKNIQDLKLKHSKEISSLIKKYTTEIKEWQNKCESIGMNTLDSTVESSNSNFDVKHYEDKIADLNDEIKHLKKLKHEQLSENSKREETLKQDLDKIKKENSELRKEISTLKSRNEHLEKTAKNQQKADKEIVKYQAMIADLERELKNANKNEDKLLESANSETESLSGQKDDMLHLKQELTVNQCELRALNRKLENKSEICNILRSELQETKQKLAEYERSLDEEKKKILENSEVLTNYKNEIDNSKIIIRNKDSEIMNLKCLIEKTNNNLDVKLKEWTKMEDKLNKRITELLDRNEGLIKEIESCKRKNADLNYLLEKKTNELEEAINKKEHFCKMNDKLKKLNLVLEEELKEYALKIPSILNQQKSSSCDEINSLRKQVDDLKKRNQTLINDLDNVNSQLKDQSEQHKILLEKEKIERNKLSKELEIEISKIKRLEEKITNLEETLIDNESQFKQTLEQKNIELINIKEEASKHITNLSLLEKEKEKLQIQCTLCHNEIERLRERITVLQKELDFKYEESINNKIFYEETLAQHKKLIEYMQESKYSDKTKKLFNSISKSNEESIKKSEDLVKELKREREKNCYLNDKLNEMIQEFDRSCQEVEKLKNKVKKLESNLKTSDGASSSCSSSSNQSHNKANLIHNYTKCTVKFITQCVACARNIHFGQKAKRCLNCNAIVHSKCNLVNNCGLSLEEIRAQCLGYGRDDLFDYSNSDTPTSSTRGDVVPTAPTEPTEDDDDDEMINVMVQHGSKY